MRSIDKLNCVNRIGAFQSEDAPDDMTNDVTFDVYKRLDSGKAN